ncbi:MAG TPA: nicotinate (nicotinamide) nucleotide adenylyltransferase, partial [Chitinophagaceae bacterium]|nr:nicotinate (nicotinamide) nucleotide adenylyltransferase [Chitinophagaceae bacterium]
IGLYFGSFNPIHIGHLIIANYFANNSGLDQVWFVISPQNPLKKEGTLLHEQHRKFLIDLAIEGEKKLKTSNVEFRLPRPSFTVTTMAYLAEKYPQHIFSIIMGSDSFSNIANWKNYEVLIKSYEIYIYERPDFKIENKHGAKIYVLKAPLLDISSTYIRKQIQEKKSIRFLVPDSVKEEIEKQHYYSDYKPKKKAS